MTAAILVLAGGWAMTALVALMAHRPAPARVRALSLVVSRRAPRLGSQTPVFLGRISLRLGSRIRRRFGRPPCAFRDRRLGNVVIVFVALVAMAPSAAVFAAMVSWALPGLRRTRCQRRLLAAFTADLPDTVDLLALAVGAGLTVSLAVAAVARRASGPLAAELARASAETALGRRLADALDDIPARAGDGVRPLIAALVASERYGSPLSSNLERLATEVRSGRRRAAEEVARRIPVKLLFPLVSCTLPAFALLTVAPLIASAVRSLRT